MYDGQQLFHEVFYKRVKQYFGGVLQVAHEAVFVEARRLRVEHFLASLALVFQRSNMGRQQAVQDECVALCFSKCSALVEARMQQQFIARKTGADHRRLLSLRGRGFFGHCSRLLKFNLLAIFEEETSFYPSMIGGVDGVSRPLSG